MTLAELQLKGPGCKLMSVPGTVTTLSVTMCLHTKQRGPLHGLFPGRGWLSGGNLLVVSIDLREGGCFRARTGGLVNSGESIELRLCQRDLNCLKSALHWGK